MVASSVFQFQILPLYAATDRLVNYALVDGDAMLKMHHEVADGQIRKKSFRRNGTTFLHAPAMRSSPAKDLRISVQRTDIHHPTITIFSRGGQQDPFHQRSMNECQSATRRKIDEFILRDSGDTSFLKHTGQPLRLPADHYNSSAGFLALQQVIQSLTEPTSMAGDGPESCLREVATDVLRLVGSAYAPVLSQGTVEFIPGEVWDESIGVQFFRLHQIGSQCNRLVLQSPAGSLKREHVVHNDQSVIWQVVEQHPRLRV